MPTTAREGTKRTFWIGFLLCPRRFWDPSSREDGSAPASKWGPTTIHCSPSDDLHLQKIRQGHAATLVAVHVDSADTACRKSLIILIQLVCISLDMALVNARSRYCRKGNNRTFSTRVCWHHSMRSSMNKKSVMILKTTLPKKWFGSISRLFCESIAF